MTWVEILKIIANFLPVVGEFIEYIAGLSDDEWEEITKVWPSPTKMHMAKIRAEAKAMKHFFPED
jgi:hypothetical protein